MIAAADLEQLQVINAWVSFSTALSGLVFMTAYSLLAKWYKSAEGRLLMGFAFLVTFLTGYAWLVTLYASDSTLARWVRLLGVGLFGALMLVQTLMMWRAQTDRQEHRRNS